MSNRLVIASRNEKKKRELLQIIDGSDLEIITLNEIPEAPEVEEDGLTFRENAIKKAQTAMINRVAQMKKDFKMQ
jgi:XTP/dITP diphosphohydrolase